MEERMKLSDLDDAQQGTSTTTNTADIPTGMAVRVTVMGRPVPQSLTNLGNGVGVTRTGMRHLYFTLVVSAGKYSDVHIPTSLALPKPYQPAYDHMPCAAQRAVDMSRQAWKDIVNAEAFMHVAHPPVPEEFDPWDIIGGECAVVVKHTPGRDGRLWLDVGAWLSPLTTSADLAAAWHEVGVHGATEFMTAWTDGPRRTAPTNGTTAQALRRDGPAWAAKFLQAQPQPQPQGMMAQPSPMAQQPQPQAQAQAYTNPHPDISPQGYGHGGQWVPHVQVDACTTSQQAYAEGIHDPIGAPLLDVPL